jgi:hypothetical protein
MAHAWPTAINAGQPAGQWHGHQAWLFARYDPRVALGVGQRKPYEGHVDRAAREPGGRVVQLTW